MARQQKSTNGNGSDNYHLLQVAQTLDSESDVHRVMNEETGVTVLSPQQWQAINLLVSGKRQADIADEIGVSQETLSRWRNSPVYGAALNQAIRDCYTGTVGLVRSSVVDALDTIKGCLQSEDEKVRLQAAVTLIKLHLQLDSAALALPTTPAKVADVQLRSKQMTEMDRLLLSL